MRARHAGFTLVELLIVVALIGILAALTAPFLLAAKSASNEASAIGSLRTINSGQAAYSSSCGANFYTAQMATLLARHYVSEDMVLNPKSGFAFALVVGLGGQPGVVDCLGGPTTTTYYSTAAPLSANTGRRGFASNSTGVIWEDRTGGVPAEPFTVGATTGPIQ